MTKNMGQLDRMVRIIVAIAIVAVLYGTDMVTSDLWTWVLRIVALVLIVTSALGSCPPYAILGINTCKRS